MSSTPWATLPVLARCKNNRSPPFAMWAINEALARHAVAEFEQNKSYENGAWANAMLTRNLLGQGKIPEARQVADRAVALSLQSSNRYPRFEAALASARVMTALGNTAMAERKAASVLAEARKYGYIGYEFEARLVLGEVEIRSPRRSAGQARLAALEKDASTKGFRL